MTNNNSKRTILLFGGNGMVGRAIQAYNKNLTEPFDISCPNSFNCNLMNLESVVDWIGAVKPDIVINCAAKVGGIGANVNNQYEFMKRNLEIGMNFVKALEKYNVPIAINIGSSCMYPRDFSQPLKEEYLGKGELEPTNFGYGMAKLTAANLLKLSGKGKTIIAPNMYGPNDNFDLKSSHLIPSIIVKTNRYKDGEANDIVIWGSGEVRREFMFVDDFVDGLFMCIENWSKIPDIMNLGVGSDHSVREYYDMVYSIVGGKEPKYFCHFNSNTPEGMKQKLMDSSYVLNTLQWKPSTSLKQGLKITNKWYVDNVKSK